MATLKNKPTHTKTFDGKIINIADMQESLRVNFPSYCQKDIDDYGTPFLSNCVMNEPECGCEIIGNGTLQFPLTIKFCAKHKYIS